MAWLVVFCTWGYVNSFGTFQAYYSTNLGETASTISWIGSIQVWVLFFLGTFAGRAMDAGYFVPTFAVGTVFQLIGIFMTSLSTKYWQLFLAQGVCTGIGSGILFTPAMALLSTYFSSHKGIAVALATTGNSAGGAIFPLIARQLLPQIGFGWTIRVLGLLNLVCLCTAGIAMKPRLPPRKSGPLVDTSAFKEIEYMLFSIGMCFHVSLKSCIYHEFTAIEKCSISCLNLRLPMFSAKLGSCTKLVLLQHPLHTNITNNRCRWQACISSIITSLLTDAIS